ECGCRGSEGHGTADLELRPEPDGSYKVEHFEKDAPSRGGGWSFGGEVLGDGPRTYFVQVKSERYGTSEAIYDPARDREVTVAFLAPALLRVTIAGYAESPDRDRASLSLEPKDEEDAGGGDDVEARINRAGTASFPPQKPGRYDLVLRLAGADGARGHRMARWNASEVSRQTLSLGSGETTMTIPLPTLCELLVTFEGEAPDLQRAGPDGVPHSVGRNRAEKGERSVTFTDLAAGRYRLLTRTGDMWVDVPAPGSVAFRPNPYNAYLLQVLDTGYLLELGLRTGDLVVALDGVEFKDRASMDAALFSWKQRGPATFTILRDGRRFDVVADAKRFEEDEGSYYRPWSR
ncbi:MAG: PDZ domain-containing protein, partial [Planctomycetes bacterium]|nr:PDZ domain-containing protein [Planctomycetota bacterium]